MRTARLLPLVIVLAILTFTGTLFYFGTQLPAKFPDYRAWTHVSGPCNDRKIAVTLYQEDHASFPIIEYTNQYDQTLRLLYYNEKSALFSVPTYKDGLPIIVDLEVGDDVSAHLLLEFERFIEPDEAMSHKAAMLCQTRTIPMLRLELSERFRQMHMFGI